ncbi:hypothetical protein B0H10DRAFT_1956116 [Mycena sp. CBHHK59/15]|nr:hypothetical protein B0H10DRAFT_1956116 [Mycena sp. CBHHK59/15]
MLPSSHRSSSSGSVIQNLDFRIQKLESENSVLQAENDAIKAAYQELVNAVPTLLAVTSNPFNLPVADQASLNLGMTPSLPPLVRGDYPNIRFWLRVDFFKGGDGVSNNGGPFLRGGSLASQGVNVSGCYIEYEDGRVVDGFHVTAIGKLAARIWHYLLEHGKAPRKWSQATVEVIKLYNNEMCRQYPELRFCADNWKAQQITTANYPSWIRIHGAVQLKVENGATRIVSAKKGKQRRKPSLSPPPNEMRKKVKLDDENLLALNPLWQPSLLASSEDLVPLPKEISAQHTLSRYQLGQFPTSDVLFHRGSGLSSDALVSGLAAAQANPGSAVAGDALAIENVAQPAEAATTLVTLETTVAITAPVPPASSEVTNPAADAAAHAALIQTAFPPQTVPAPTTSQAAASASPVSPALPIVRAPPAAKKDSKMTATNSLTPRFKKTICVPASGSQNTMRWNKASAQAKATAAANVRAWPSHIPRANAYFLGSPSHCVRAAMGRGGSGMQLIYWMDQLAYAGGGGGRGSVVDYPT